MQRFQEPLCGILSQVADNRGEQFAVFAESAVSKSMRYIVDGGLGHQVEDVHHSVSDVAAAHRLFDEFRQPLLRADPWPQALRRTRPLCLYTLQRRECLLHRRVAALGRCLLAQAHKRRAHQRLQFRFSLNGQLVAQTPDRLHQLVRHACGRGEHGLRGVVRLDQAQH